jgi:hypothetical protein
MPGEGKPSSGISAGRAAEVLGVSPVFVEALIAIEELPVPCSCCGLIDTAAVVDWGCRDGERLREVADALAQVSRELESPEGQG